MSFMHTTDQIRNRTKTVTRRLGWNFLKPGDILNACVKCQGIPKGGKIERICQIRVVSIRKERLYDISWYVGGGSELKREGFPEMKPEDFVWMFCRKMKCLPWQFVNRIEFEYVDDEGSNAAND
jgi:hypothetical protein